MNFFTFSVLFSSLFFSSCASMRGSLSVASLSGVAVGATTGAVFAPQNKSKVAFKGALIGGVIGLAAGYFAHKALEKRDRKVRRELLFNLENFGVDGIEKGREPKPACSLLGGKGHASF